MAVLTTFDPAQHAAGFVLSNANLTATDTASGSGWANGRGTVSYTSGKKFYELTIVANGSTFGTNGAAAFGVGNASASLTSAPGSDVNGACWYPWAGLTFIHGGTGTIQSDTTNGHVGLCAVDITAGLIWWSINGGNYNNSALANPVTGVGGLSIAAITGALFPYAGLTQSGIVTANFGASSFNNTVHTTALLTGGFLAWNGAAYDQTQFFL